jgi:hypothetical protein
MLSSILYISKIGEVCVKGVAVVSYLQMRLPSGVQESNQMHLYLDDPKRKNLIIVDFL